MRIEVERLNVRNDRSYIIGQKEMKLMLTIVKGHIKNEQDLV